jgi:hypothetical protein
MALNKSNFDPTGSGSKGSAPKVMTYTTSDAIATVEGANYFNALEDIIATGDVLYCNMSDGAKFYRCTNTAGVITIATEVAFA